MAIKAFRRVEPLLTDQLPLFLAQPDAHMAHALMDCAFPFDAAARAPAPDRTGAQPPG